MEYEEKMLGVRMDRRKRSIFKAEAERRGYSMADAINYMVAAFLDGRISLPKKGA